MLRRLLTVLLCACLVLQGTTIALAAESRCPMQSDIEAMAHGGDRDRAAMPDCCNDLETWAETGQPCKSGFDCQGFVAWAAVPAVPPAAAARSFEAPVGLIAPVPAAQPATPWRPPAAL